MKRVLAYFIFQKLCKVTKVFFNLQIYGAKNKYKKHTIYIYLLESKREAKELLEGEKQEMKKKVKKFAHLFKNI